MEGIVQISIKDFDELRETSRELNSLITALRASTSCDVKETIEGSDEWYQIIKVDAKKVANIAAGYSDVEDIYNGDVIKLINISDSVVEK